MKAYLLTSGTIFGLIGAMHCVGMVQAWRTATSDPHSLVENGLLGALSVALAVWAFLLFRVSRARGV